MTVERVGAGPLWPRPGGVAGGPRKFADVLGAKLRLSAHAQLRLEGAPITEGEARRLDEAARELSRKGGRSALVVVGQRGFLLSVPSRTVITAFSADRLEGAPVTQIDSAMFFAQGAGPQRGAPDADRTTRP